jgi:hypothetical protein
MRLLSTGAAWILLWSILPACAQVSLDRNTPAAAWAADQIKHHNIANFNNRCGRLDPTKDPEDRWSDPCRTINPSDLVSLLLAEEVPREGVRLDGVRVDGNLDLTAVEIKHEVTIVDSRLDGDIDLSRALVKGRFMLDGTRITGQFDGRRLHAESDLLMRYGAMVKGQIALVDATIDGNLDLEGSTFEKPVNGDRLRVSGSLFMNNHATFKSEIFIHYAAVDGNLEMEASTFESGVKGEGLKVSHHLFMGNAVFHHPVSIPYSRISGNLDLSAGTFTQIDLSAANVGQTLILRGPYGVAKWQQVDGLPTLLTLRNAHAGTLQEGIGSWPDRLDLEGFSYERLGGYDRSGAIDTGSRSTEEWIGWLQKSSYAGKSFDPQPYIYLSQILNASGNRSKALALQFAARQAERAQARADGDWRQWAWLSALRWLCGYGIGIYTFYVVPWVFGSVVVGVLVLLGARAARAKGVFWCIGASLERLLPIIELNKEFGEFFYDPLRDRLQGWQIAFFSIYALWGWVLGLLLVAAMSGLTQGT